MESGEGAGQSAWDRLRSRKVVQWGLGYVAMAWGLLQATEFAVSTFHWPEVVTRVATVAAVCGLPIALTLAWFHGEHGNQRFRRMEIVILALLVLTGVVAVRFEARTALKSAAIPSLVSPAPKG